MLWTTLVCDLLYTAFSSHTTSTMDAACRQTSYFHIPGCWIEREVIVNVRDAKQVAQRWVHEEGRGIPGFHGAFIHGSMNWLPDDAALPGTSDVDVMVVLADSRPAIKPGKFFYRDIMLEVSYASRDQLQSPEQVLGKSDLAGSFHGPSVISDPTGQLTDLQTAVAANYAKRRWVRERCAHARNKVLRNLQSLNEADPFHDQVTAWLFGTGVTTHILLVAGLKNPTVRQRYVTTRDLLTEYGHLDYYGTLLEMLGCDSMSRGRVEHHLDALTEAFDAAKAVIKTPYFFAADISDLARPIAIDGSRELIERGYHREAIFWIVATASRCQKVLHHDAPPDLQERFNPPFRELLGDLGIASFADLLQRADQAQRSLPKISDLAEVIMVANPEIED